MHLNFISESYRLVCNLTVDDKSELPLPHLLADCLSP